MANSIVVYGLATWSLDFFINTNVTVYIPRGSPPVTKLVLHFTNNIKKPHIQKRVYIKRVNFTFSWSFSLLCTLAFKEKNYWKCLE